MTGLCDDCLLDPTRRVSVSGLGRAALKLLVIPLALVLLLAGAAVAGQAWAEHDEQARFPAPGRTVNLGNGQLMHVRSWGVQLPGRPTLILLAGAAIPSSAWGWIGPALAADYHVVAVDRPGMGWSFGGGGQRTAQGAADSIGKALSGLGIRPPWVVVAHSFAGFSGRVFIGQHRLDILAAVMLDTSIPEAPGAGYGFFYRMSALRAHLGTAYLFPPPNGYSNLPPNDAAAAYAVSRWTSHQDASADELDVWDVSAEQTRQAGTFGDMPLLVVTTTGSSEAQLEWQHAVERLSSRSEFVVLNVGHTQMLTEPDQAAMVIDEIRDFLGRTLPAP
jgi:pimeloyl-ACP methyl ester carboxylesterase